MIPTCNRHPGVEGVISRLLQRLALGRARQPATRVHPPVSGRGRVNGTRGVAGHVWRAGRRADRTGRAGSGSNGGSTAGIPSGGRCVQVLRQTAVTVRVLAVS